MIAIPKSFHSLSRIAQTVLAAFCLSACAMNEALLPHNVPRQVPFNETEFAALPTSGSAVVRGRAYLVNNDNSEEPALRTAIELAPVTPYTTEIFQKHFARGIYLTPPDPRYKKYVRRTVTDDNGNFQFLHLPSGRYYVGSKVPFTGTSATTYDDGSSEEFAEPCYQWIYAEISLSSGQTVTIDSWTSGPERIGGVK